MSNSFEYIDIILIAMIAAFIFLRLKNILGRKTGYQGKTTSKFYPRGMEIIKDIENNEAIKNNNVDEDAKKHLLLAGGIGVTPMIAMIYELEDRGCDYFLHYCTRSREKSAFYEFLKLRENEGRVLFYHDQGNPENGLDLKARHLLLDVINMKNHCMIFLL